MSNRVHETDLHEVQQTVNIMTNKKNGRDGAERDEVMKKKRLDF